MNYAFGFKYRKAYNPNSDYTPVIVVSIPYYVIGAIAIQTCHQLLLSEPSA